MSIYAPSLVSTTSTAAVATSQTTTSTSFTDLATAGPAVTLTTGTLVLVIIHGKIENNTAGQWAVMDVTVSGATTRAAADATALMNGQTATTVDGMVSASSVIPLTVTAGSNTFTAKYRVTAGTGTFVNRSITVIPL